MPVTEQNIVFYESAETPSIGGAITVTPVPQGIDLFFNNVDEDEAEAGSVHYRCFYVKNESLDSTLYSAGIYISVRTPNPSTSCELGPGASGLDGSETAIADETVPPAGVAFKPSAVDDVVEIGDLAPGEWFPIWVKRTVLANAAGSAVDYLVMTVVGDRGTLLD